MGRGFAGLRGALRGGDGARKIHAGWGRRSHPLAPPRPIAIPRPDLEKSQRLWLFFSPFSCQIFAISCWIFTFFQIFDPNRPARRLLKFQPAWSYHPLSWQQVGISSTQSGQVGCGLSTNPIRPDLWTGLVSIVSFTWEWLALSFFFFCFHLAFSSHFPSCNFLSQWIDMDWKVFTFSPSWFLLHFMTFTSTAFLPFE